MKKSLEEESEFEVSDMHVGKSAKLTDPWCNDHYFANEGKLEGKNKSILMESYPMEEVMLDLCALMQRCMKNYLIFKRRSL